MRRAIGILLFTVFMLPALVFSDSWPVFINNKPFKGKVAGKTNQLFLEAKILAEMTKIGLKVDEASKAATLNDEKLATEEQGGVLMVDVQDLVKRLNGKYSVNKDLQTVDIYLLAGKTEEGPAGGAMGGVTALDITVRNKTFHYTIEDGDVFEARYPYSGRESGVAFHVMPLKGQTDYRLEFGAPGKKALQVGSYDYAVRFPFNQGNQAGMDITVGGSGNNKLEGRFDILDVGYSEKGPSHFAVNFLMFGEGMKEYRIEGSLRYHTTVPRRL